MKQTFFEAGYKYIKYLGNKEHLIQNLLNAGNGMEIWIANKNHASYGIKYKNTHLEFARSLFFF